jgi:hypothetical protein
VVAIVWVETTFRTGLVLQNSVSITIIAILQGLGEYNRIHCVSQTQRQPMARGSTGAKVARMGWGN